MTSNSDPIPAGGPRVTGVKAQAEALLNALSTYEHCDDATLAGLITHAGLAAPLLPSEHDEVKRMAEATGVTTLARQVVELAEEVERLHNRVRMLEYDNDGHLEMLGELHGELPDGATKETLGRLLRDWGTASDQSAYVPRAVLTEVHKELAAAVEALGGEQAIAAALAHLSAR